MYSHLPIISSSYKDSSHLELGSLSDPLYLFRAYLQIQSHSDYLGLEFQHMNFVGTQFNHKNLDVELHRQ
jgi:hypothetical protein